MKFPRRREERAVEFVNDLWTVAHGRLPLAVRDLKTGRPACPWLTAITDFHSRCVVGISVSAQAPSAKNVLYAFRLGLVRNKRALDPRERTPLIWHRHGVPQELELDSATEFKTGALHIMTEEIRVRLVYRPGEEAWFWGPLVEWLGRRSRTRIDLLDTDSDEERLELLPVFELADVSPLLTNWVIENYHQQVQPGLGCTPAEKRELGLRPIPPMEFVQWEEELN
jgi:putative transposase